MNREHEIMISKSRGSRIPSWAARMVAETRIAALGKDERYAPCPCGSGKKYKFCCGLKK